MISMNQGPPIGPLPVFLSKKPSKIRLTLLSFTFYALMGFYHVNINIAKWGLGFFSVFQKWVNHT